MMNFKTIHSRIFSMLSLIIILSTILIFSYLQHDLKSRIYKSFDSVTQTINNTLVANIRGYVYNKDQENIQYVIDSIKSDYIDDILILDINGNVISSQKKSIVNKITYQHFKVLKQSNNNTLKDDKQYIILNTFELLEVPLGYLVVEGDIKYYLTELHQKLIELIILGVSLFFMAIIVAFYLSKRISKPLNNIIATLHSTKENEVLIFKKESEEEFKYLIKTIEQKHNALLHLNTKLEDEVEYKTAELKSSYLKLEKSNYQKEILLNEIHHRIKNNLHMISSMLGLQQKDEKNPKLTKILEKSRLRIQSIVMIHEILYRYESFEKIEFHNYAKKLCDIILDLYDSKANIMLNDNSIFLSVEDTLKYGIITNELLTNSLKHAFTKGEEGEITISLTQTKNYYIYKYSDNGKMIVDEKEFMKENSLGLKIIHMMVEQMGAKVDISFENGLGFEIVTGCGV